MSTFAAIEMGGQYDGAAGAVGVASNRDSWSQQIGLMRAWRLRQSIECVAVIVAGAVMALGYALLSPADAGLSARREGLERQLTGLAAPMAEYARLVRAGQAAQASAAAAARERPALESHLLLETLSQQAHAGVTVRRLRQSRAGYEMQIHAPDSAACAAWVTRLARVPGWERAAIVDLRLVAGPTRGQTEGARVVEANVRVPSRLSPTESVSTRAGVEPHAADGRRMR